MEGTLPTTTEALGQVLAEVDGELATALRRERERQQYCINLIPSENYVSRAVLEASGCVMTNKYAEGYPGHRYYPGCTWVDEVERLALERCKALFGADHANVQPLSGALANMAVYYALLKPGDTILAPALNHGGHLTHGARVNFSSRYYGVVSYQLDPETERFEPATIRALTHAWQPRLIMVGFSAYPRQVDWAPWRDLADEIGAYLVADIAHTAGLIAAGLHPNPVPYCDAVTGTTHKTLRGPRGAFILCRDELAQEIDHAVFPGVQAGPFMHQVAAKAVCFAEAATPTFRAYQEQVLTNARVLAERLRDAGFRLVTGGTDTHLLLVDLCGTPWNGADAQVALEEAGIFANKNTIPFDNSPPVRPMGLRPGTPAVTTRGFRAAEMDTVADFLLRVLQHPDRPEFRVEVREDARALCKQFPLYEFVTP